MRSVDGIRRQTASGHQYAEGSSFKLVGNQTLLRAVDCWGKRHSLTFNANGGSGSMIPLHGVTWFDNNFAGSDRNVGCRIRIDSLEHKRVRCGHLLFAGSWIQDCGIGRSLRRVERSQTGDLVRCDWVFQEKSLPYLSASLKSQINRIAITIRSRKVCQGRSLWLHRSDGFEVIRRRSESSSSSKRRRLSSQSDCATSEGTAVSPFSQPEKARSSVNQAMPIRESKCSESDHAWQSFHRLKDDELP